MSQLENYYKGDQNWMEYSNSVNSHWVGSEYQNKLLAELNNQIDLAKVIYYHNSESSIKWINSKIPALDYLTPLECLSAPELVKRLKVCLTRFPC